MKSRTMVNIDLKTHVHDNRVKVIRLGGSEYYWKWFVQFCTEDDNLAYEYSGNWDTFEQAIDHAQWCAEQIKQLAHV